MNRCPNCAALNRVGAKFCTSCGFRLPAEEVVAERPHDRSPFSTTSTLPWTSEEVAVGENPGGADANGATQWKTDATGTGLSWDAPPPVDRAVPVSDEMISQLLGEEEAPEAALASEQAPDPAPDESFASFETVPNALEDTPETPVVRYSAPEPTRPTSDSSGSTSIDSLLKLVRELEYGLIELADAPQASAPPTDDAFSTEGLAIALSALQDDEGLIALRTAIGTAQERPRDVDVMLDLVLRADAIAEVINERDMLKRSIQSALNAEDNDDDIDDIDDDDDDADDGDETTDLGSESDEIKAEDADVTESTEDESE